MTRLFGRRRPKEVVSLDSPTPEDAASTPRKPHADPVDVEAAMAGAALRRNHVEAARDLLERWQALRASSPVAAEMLPPTPPSATSSESSAEDLDRMELKIVSLELRLADEALRAEHAERARERADEIARRRDAEAAFEREHAGAPGAWETVLGVTCGVRFACHDSDSDCDVAACGEVGAAGCDASCAEVEEGAASPGGVRNWDHDFANDGPPVSWRDQHACDA